ncbi:unnamed protein product [Durusdinium trenchii]|uniref:Phosphoethanolamine N-methyltransferase 3 n=2 Tax=Durusdinium trenchii TaxID=1381693 RepID=A0ABP0NS67_9DINO
MGGRLEPLRRVAQVAEALLCRAHGGWTTVVDLGCGTGLFAQFLANVPGLRVVGVDLSEGHLQVARRHMEVIKASYLDWEPDDWTPDVAVHNNSIEDYEDSVKLYFFKHVFRWLAPGGYLLFQAYSPRDEPMGPCISECSPDFASKHTIFLCDTERYAELARDAGFEMISSELIHSKGRYPPSEKTYQREFIFIVFWKPLT